jgi:hypothetical protein
MSYVMVPDCCDTGRCPRNVFEAFRYFFTGTR